MRAGVVAEMGTARQHHFQPQAYLRGFANDRDQVRVFDRQKRREVAITNVRNVAGQRDLYRFGSEEVESDLSHLVDGPAAALMTRVLEPFPPTPEDRVQLADYLALLYARNPAFKQFLRKAAGSRFKRDAMDWAQTLLAETDVRIGEVLGGYPDFALDVRSQRVLLKTIADGDYEIEVVDAAAHVRAMASPIVAALSGAIAARAWGLARAAPAADFVTSDRALAWSSPPGDPANTIFNATFLQFPVNRHHVLKMAGFRGLPDTTAVYSPDLVAEANSLTAAMASRFLYAHPESDEDVFIVALQGRSHAS